VSALTVTADASGSTDTDQTPILKVIFNFGDGTVVTAQSGITATHTYSSPGTYTVAVAVIDTAHLSTTVSATVTVS
jgi:PKD repeat protein